MQAAALADEWVASAAGGAQHSLAVTESGKLFAWGLNAAGALGVNTAGPMMRLTPVRVSLRGWGKEEEEQVAMAAAGEAHSVAVTKCGRVFSWGHGALGALGLPDLANRPAPVLVETGVRQCVRVAVRVRVCDSPWRRRRPPAGRGLWTPRQTSPRSAGASRAHALSFSFSLSVSHSLTHPPTHLHTLCVIHMIFFEYTAGERVALVAAGYAHSILVTEEGDVWSSGPCSSAWVPPPAPAFASQAVSGAADAGAGAGGGRKRGGLAAQGGGIWKVESINLFSPLGCTVEVCTRVGELERQQLLYRRPLTYVSSLPPCHGEEDGGCWGEEVMGGQAMEGDVLQDGRDSDGGTAPHKTSLTVSFSDCF